MSEPNLSLLSELRECDEVQRMAVITVRAGGHGRRKDGRYCSECKVFFQWDKSGHKFSNREFFDHIKTCGLEGPSSSPAGFSATVFFHPENSLKIVDDCRILEPKGAEDGCPKVPGVGISNKLADDVQEPIVIEDDENHKTEVKDEPFLNEISPMVILNVDSVYSVLASEGGTKIEHDIHPKEELSIEEPLFEMEEVQNEIQPGDPILLENNLEMLDLLLRHPLPPPVEDAEEQMIVKVDPEELVIVEDRDNEDQEGIEALEQESGGFFNSYRNLGQQWYESISRLEEEKTLEVEEEEEEEDKTDRCHYKRCQKRFLGEGVLSRRSCIHIREERFRCLKCCATFSRADRLRAHNDGCTSEVGGGIDLGDIAEEEDVEGK